MFVKDYTRLTLVERVVSCFIILSIASVTLMMIVTFIAVLMRYLFNLPILGVNEIIQLLSVSCVFMAMPYATQTDAHVRVDILDKAIGPYGRMFGDIQSYSLSLFVLSILVYRTGLKLLDSAEFNDATNMLGIYIWPFYGLIILGIGLSMVVITIKLYHLFIKKESNHE